jgi:hypothetical protein
MDVLLARWTNLLWAQTDAPTQIDQPCMAAELFRCLLAMGKIRGTLRMRSHIFVLRPTTKFFAKSFVFKNNGAKEGLRKDGSEQESLNTARRRTLRVQ